MPVVWGLLIPTAPAIEFSDSATQCSVRKRAKQRPLPGNLAKVVRQGSQHCSRRQPQDGTPYVPRHIYPHCHSAALRTTRPTQATGSSLAWLGSALLLRLGLTLTRESGILDPWQARVNFARRGLSRRRRSRAAFSPAALRLCVPASEARPFSVLRRARYPVITGASRPTCVSLATQPVHRLLVKPRTATWM